MLEKTTKKRKLTLCIMSLMTSVLYASPPCVDNSLAQSKPDWRWQLTASGRFAHRKEYVESVGEAHSLKLVHYEPMTDFRFENGVGVQGHIFVMQKQPSKSANQEL